MNRRAYVAAVPEVRDELVRLFKPNQGITIFDIGACEGEDSVRYARMFPNARVLAFEPVPENIRRCQKTLDEYGVRNVELVQCAMSNEDGAGVLYVSSGHPPDAHEADDWDYGNKSSSLLEPGLHLQVHPWVEFKSRIEVQTRRLDTLCAELGVDRLDFVHLDVQGAELLVLEGAGERLREVRATWLEVEAIPLYRGQPVAKDVESFLRIRGYRKEKDTVGKISGDQLWVRGD